MKKLSAKTKQLLSIIIVVFLTITLALFVWAVATQRLDLRKRASSGEPGICIPVNKVVTVTPTNSEGNDPNDTGCHNIQTAIDSVIGDGYTVLITPGEYFVSGQVNVDNKSNITIKGDETQGSGAVVLNFNAGGGFNFLIQNSSGYMEWLTIRGGSSNGMLSIHNSNNFSVGYLSAYSETSHTMDIQNSNNISVYNTELQSSAGALEVSNSNNINISNNRIHNSSTGISISNSSYINIHSNLVTENIGGGIRLWNVSNTNTSHNTIVYNTGSSPTVNISGTNASPNIFSQNIVAFNIGAGIVKEANSDNFSLISNNDVYSNYSGYNYAGMSNPTGQNGNISADPLFGEGYCLNQGSPAVYGNVGNGEYMGTRVYCNGVSPSPTPDPNLVISCQQQFSDSFNTTNSIPNPSIWLPSTSAYVNNDTDTLVIQAPINVDNSYALRSINTVEANEDFQMEVDVKQFLTGFNSNNDLATAELKAYNSDSNYFTIRWVRWQDSSGVHSKINLWSTLSGQTTQAQGIDVPFNSAPRLKLVRNGNTIKGYYNTGNGFIEVPSLSNVYTGQVKPTLFIYKRGMESSHVEFDNFTFGCPSLPALKIGDVNNDNKVNLIDIGIAVDYYDSTNPANPRADVNRSGKVDLIDIGLIIDNYEW